MKLTFCINLPIYGIRYCFILLYQFYNFVILSGLLLFVFGVDSEVAFCRL